MRRSVSADSFLSNVSKVPKPNSKSIQYLLKKSRCTDFSKYKTGMIISGTILMSCYTATNDVSYEIIGTILTTGYFTINLGFSYLENYLIQVDQWRLQEAEYEEKTDPPEWNWKIINYTSHLAIIFNLLACLVELNDHLFYIGTGLQVVSFSLRLYNDYKSTKILIMCLLDFISMVLFIINKIHTSNLLIFSGTYIYIISELISI